MVLHIYKPEQDGQMLIGNFEFCGFFFVSSKKLLFHTGDAAAEVAFQHRMLTCDKSLYSARGATHLGKSRLMGFREQERLPMPQFALRPV